METWSLPNKGRSLASALMLRRFLGSWRSCFLLYSQICLVTSVRGRAPWPITAARVGLGVSGFRKAALGLRVAGFFSVLAMNGTPEKRVEGAGYALGHDLSVSIP